MIYSNFLVLIFYIIDISIPILWCGTGKSSVPGLCGTPSLQRDGHLKRCDAGGLSDQRPGAELVVSPGGSPWADPLEREV